MSELVKERIEIPNNEGNVDFKELEVSQDAYYKMRKSAFWVAIFISVMCLAFICSVILSIINSNNDKILSNVYIGNSSVENLTKEEAKAKLEGIICEKLKKEITLKHDSFEQVITLEQISAKYNVEKAIEEAYSVGRDGNIFKNNYKIFLTIINKTQMDAIIEYDEEKLTGIVNEIQGSIEGHIIQPQYRREESNLIIEKGKEGIAVDYEELKGKIENELLDLNSDSTEIKFSVKTEKPEEVDVQELRNTIFVEPQDAYFVKDPYEVRKHVDGVDFAISIEEAKQILSKNQEEYIIPLKITTPKITIKQLGNEAFPDNLATYSTRYNTGKVNRSNNIVIASRAINGYVLMPGESFSYNQVVGKRTSARGYKPAPSYVGGEVVDSVGGGICQVSSTLYNSVLLSNLEVIERYNHCYTPDYVPVCRDATVAWGGVDFKFKNNRNYPIKIVCSGGGGTVKVDILGLKTAEDYNVKLQSYVTGYVGAATVYKNDPSLPVGTTKVTSGGSSGCYAVGYKILEKDGVQISKTLISKDRYNAHNRVVLVGTAGQ